MIKLKSLLTEGKLPEALRKSLAMCPKCNQALSSINEKNTWVCKECMYIGPNEPLNEADAADTSDWRYWWMDPNLKFHGVEHEGHAGFATHYLSNHYPAPSKIDINDIKYKDKYYVMYALGWVRVGLSRYQNKLVLSFNYNPDKSLSDRQMRALNQAAKDLGADEMRDNAKGIWKFID